MKAYLTRCPPADVYIRERGDSLAKYAVAFFNISRLSYLKRGSCAIQEPSSGTAFMPGDGEGRIVSRSVVMGRGGVRSPSSFLMT